MSERQKQTILVGEPGFEEEHEVGDTQCAVAWCVTSTFIKTCRCGGVIHAAFGDDTDEGYWCWHKCDRCDDDWEFARND